MSRISRIFMLSGLLLATVSLVFALVNSYWLDHKSRLAEYDAYQPVLQSIVDGAAPAQWQASLEDINHHSRLHRKASVFHTHAIKMGILLMLVGLFLPLLGESRKHPGLLVWSFLGFACLYPAGLFLQYLGLILTGQVFAAASALLAIFTLGLLYRSLAQALESIFHLTEEGRP